MSKKIIVTESQMTKFLNSNKKIEEDFDVRIDPNDANGNINNALQKTDKQVEQSGVDKNKVSYVVQADLVDSKIYTKKQLKENSLSKRKKDSKIYKAKDLLLRK